MSARMPDADLRTHRELDVTDGEAVDRAVAQHDSVIHLAAITHVDRCEVEPDRAWLVNAKGSENIARASARCGARLILLSTDYVFDGLKGSAYTETDRPSPINVYGRTKWEAEMACATVPDHLVVRASWIFGEGRNFISTILERAKTSPPVRVVADQIGRPTAAVGVADALLFLLEGSETGILHVAGNGPPCSWADLAEYAIASAHISTRVERIDSDTYASSAADPIAARPPNSTLALDKARSLGIPLLDWRTAVDRYVRSSV